MLEKYAEIFKILILNKIFLYNIYFEMSIW